MDFGESVGNDLKGCIECGMYTQNHHHISKLVKPLVNK